MTEYFLGKREQIAMCEEDTWATLGTKTMSSDGYIVGKNATITPDFSKGWQEVLTAGADSRDIESMEKGPESYNFTLNFVPVNWKFLRYCAHGTVTNTDMTTYYTHTFTNTDSVKSFTLEWAKRGNPNHVITLTGCIIKTLTITYSAGTGPSEGFIKVNAECLAKSAAPGTTVTTISAETLDAFQFRMAELTYANNEIVEVKSGELTINNGIDEQDSRYCNPTLDQQIGEPIPKTRRYTCRFNINEKDDTFFDDWNAQVVVPGINKLELLRGTNDNVVFNFTNLYLQSVPDPTSLEGIDTVDLIGIIKSIAIVAKDSLSDY